MTRKWNQGAVNADALLDAISGTWLAPFSAPVYNTPRSESQSHKDLRAKRAAKRKQTKKSKKANRN